MTLNQKQVGILAIFFLLSLLFPAVNFAQAETVNSSGIKIAGLKFHPSLSIKQEYTDNVFLEQNDLSNSSLTTASPGLKIELPLGKHQFELAYRANIVKYDKYEGLDTTTHLVNTALEFEFPVGLGAKLAYDYQKSAVTPYSTVDEEEMDFSESDVTTTIVYKFADRYKIEFNYEYEDVNYDEDTVWYPLVDGVNTQFIQSDDYRKDDASIAVYYRFLPKTSVLFELGGYQLDNDDPTGTSTDSDNYRGWLGFSWQPGEKMTGTIKGGYIARRYNEKDGGNDIDDFGLSCDLRYNHTSFDHFILTGYREILETYISTKTTPYYGSNYIHSGLDLQYCHDFTFKLSGSLYVSYNNDYFTEGEVYLSGTNKKREDNQGGFGTSIDYQIRKWLSCKLEYAYTHNDSNFNDEDYKENRVLFFVATAL